MLSSVSNILDVCSVSNDKEQFFPIVMTSSVILEKIESHGFTTPTGDWYDQEITEWVMLVTGNATLTFECGDSLSLKAGDYVTLPPHCKHRVEWCSVDASWLALHIP